MSSVAQPAPAVEAPVAPDAPPNFQDLLDLEREILAPEAREPAAEPPPAVEPPPEPPPAQPPAVKAEPTPGEPVKPPEPEAKPPEPPTEKPPEAPAVPTPEQVAEQRKAALAQIEGRFAFSEEDRERLLTAPHEVLPKLAAELQLSTYEMVLGAMHGILPNMISQHIGALSRQQASSGKFFERWPELKDPKHHAVVQKVSTAYRAAFPDATVEQAIEDIGSMAMRRVGLAPAAPSPPKAKPSSPSPTRPFAPAGTGAAASPPRPRALSDEAKMWAELVED